MRTVVQEEFLQPGFCISDFVLVEQDENRSTGGVPSAGLLYQRL
jgi:hypothetical protein